MNQETRSKAIEEAHKLFETPRSHLRVELRQTENSVVLTHKGQTLTGVELDNSGMNAASAMAIALGISIPPLGEHAETLASTGLLYRVLAISDLDFNNPTSFELANHLVDEAIGMQHGGGALSGA